MEREDHEAQRPLLVTVAGSSGDGRQGAAPPTSSSSSVAALVGSTAVAVAGSFEFGISVGYSSPCQPGIMRDFDLSIAESNSSLCSHDAVHSVFGSILTAGTMVGAFVSGTVADRVGRRCAMAVSDLLCILGYLLITFSQNFLWLDIGRLSIGCGIGLLSYVLMICCGMSLAYVLGTFITWHTLAIIDPYRRLKFIYWNIYLNEDHISEARIGHPGEFEAALQKLRGKGTDISQEAAEIKDFTEKDPAPTKVKDAGPVSQGIYPCCYSWSWANGPSTIRGE
ncbi:sugar transporter ERD6-like 5 isoform X2 [Panicum miliaceum]|uniref:Sugar transporter ERD6-like 5 isoform X2 n=1 Tax=Panicum miliaceum TaxID=4540 RepID=A0A3L6R574_PANMI|nr:sugar transporter ERD6-like 5 isoform X2 [Panicum miliaceum]